MNEPTLTESRVELVGDPEGAPRPRARVAGAPGGRAWAQMYVPKTEWDKTISKQLAILARPRPPLEGPLSVVMNFFFKRPKSHTKAQQKIPFHSVRPDIDNLAKTVLDRMTDAHWWKDDTQVGELLLRKFYVDTSRQAGCTVLVQALIDE